MALKGTVSRLDSLYRPLHTTDLYRPLQTSTVSSTDLYRPLQTSTETSYPDLYRRLYA